MFSKINRKGGISQNKHNGSSGRSESGIPCCHEAIQLIVLLLTIASGLKQVKGVNPI